IVKIVSDAELGGVLADFARTGGEAVANAIMADFAARAAAEFARDEVPVDTKPEPEQTSAAIESFPPLQRPPERTTPAAPLAAHSLLWIVLKAQFMRLGRWLGLTR